MLLGVKKAKRSHQSPKTEFGAQNQYGHVIYPSIGNFTWSKKKYTFGGQKGEIKPSKPWGPKSIWSCDISIDREFYMEQGKIYLWGSKKRKQGFRAQKRNLGPKKSKISFRAKKIKTSRHFKKCMLKKFLSGSKEKNKLEILDNWSILKEKNKNVYKFSIAIMKLNFLVFILIMFHV
jgi:hypothetical protein